MRRLCERTSNRPNARESQRKKASRRLEHARLKREFAAGTTRNAATTYDKGDYIMCDFDGGDKKNTAQLAAARGDPPDIKGTRGPCQRPSEPKTGIDYLSHRQNDRPSDSDQSPICDGVSRIGSAIEITAINLFQNADAIKLNDALKKRVDQAVFSTWENR